MTQKLPKWQRRHIEKCRRAFQLTDPPTHLHVHRLDELGSGGADGQGIVRGDAETDPRYGAAVVRLRRDLQKNAYAYEILTHEVLHAAMGLQRQAVNQILDLVPPDLRDHAERLWQDGNEPTVTGLARGLTPLLRAMHWDDAPAVPDTTGYNARVTWGPLEEKKEDTP